MLSILNKNGKPEKEGSQYQNSHEKTQKAIFDLLLERKILKNISEFSSDFRTIRIYRVKADYQNENIDKEDFENTKKITNKMKEYLNKL